VNFKDKKGKFDLTYADNFLRPKTVTSTIYKK